jgi:bifunctional non-homologous end joining protein LigD
LYAFDLLHLNGRDLIGLPIETRKGLLAELLKDTGVLFCQSFDCDAETLLAEVKRRQLEGIVAKRRGSLYRSGDRDGTWIKYKVHRQQEFIIGGYCPGNPMDSILVGYADGSQLIFAGNVQAGFNRFSRVAVFEALQSLRQKECPFANLPEKRKDRWGDHCRRHSEDRLDEPSLAISCHTCAGKTLLTVRYVCHGSGWTSQDGAKIEPVQERT